MCANYIPVTKAQRLLEYFGVVVDHDGPEGEVFPSGLAPFIRRPLSGDKPQHPARFVDQGIFRFVPDFSTRLGWARATYNARSEEVHRKVTYRQAWRDGHRCIIPAEAVYEPNYETGSSVRWRISLGTGAPMGIAGIYRSWTNADGEMVFSMAMLTVNADEHPFMRRFHAPGDEKRMVVILDPADFEAWLTCTPAEAQSRFCKPWTGPLVGEPAPLPSRARIKPVGEPKKKPAPKAPPQPDPDPPSDLGRSGDLF